ncbi:MAG: sigma-54-dependent Fis family transcriptional regulator [Alphaproteobacteria bacterium 43-37]|nr:MAG: sigma-54-dependent Fis family transcriptional regulator [Alphaproteobacteria bacterium 43-37]
MRLLIIGTLNGHITEAARIAKAKGLSVSHVETIGPAISFLRQGGADVIFIDVTLDIWTFVKSIRDERINTPVIACGIGHETKLAVQAIRAGAQEYLPLPPDTDLIAAVLGSVSTNEAPLVYQDPVMAKVVKLAEQIASSDASVLITGESGTGKEVMAHFIHEKSKRSQSSFISVNCAAIPENLLESELFGHEKGAFTGALARRIGKFEEADGGTLLLDEITEMHPRLQAKLLRAIQEREIDRVGGTKPVRVNIRLLATSNRNMMQAVKEGTFREDLYFRLNVVAIEIPPLRERKNDLVILAKHFVKKYSEVNGLDSKELNQEACNKLLVQTWRGNVRELENVIHRAVLLCESNIIAGCDIHLPQFDVSADISPAHTQLSNPAVDKNVEGVGRTVAEVERDLIINTLTHCSGNRTHAATILGISIRTLRNKIRQYRDEGIKVPDGQLDQAS